MSIHADVQAFCDIFRKRVRGHGDDRDGRRPRIIQRADIPCGVQSVHDRHLDIHEDKGVFFAFRRLYLIHAYLTVLRALRPALNAFSRWPRLPAPGGEFACSYLAYALAENDDPFLFSGLVELARRTCCGRNIVLSFHASDPLCNVVKSLGGFNYGSEFLTVKFDGCSHELHGVPYIEAGAL